MSCCYPDCSEWCPLRGLCQCASDDYTIPDEEYQKLHENDENGS